MQNSGKNTVTRIMFSLYFYLNILTNRKGKWKVNEKDTGIMKVRTSL